jgi:hypothetical protein
VKAEDLAEKVAGSAALQAQVKEDPVGTLRTLASSPLQSDNWIYRLVVLALGLTILVVASFSFVLILATDKAIPDVLVALGTGAIGALAGLLAPSPAQ